MYRKFANVGNWAGRCLASKTGWLLLSFFMQAPPVLATDLAAREAVEALEAYAVYKMAQYPEAFERFLALAQKDNIQGMLNVANMLQAGLGTARDEGAAFEWYRQAADHGSAIGMFYTGQALLQGLGTGADPKRARYWLRRAAETGSSEAQFELGKLLLQEGRQDAALTRIHLAASDGNIAAARYLAGLSENPSSDHEVTVAERLLIDAAWAAIDRAASNGNAPGIVHYLSHDAEVWLRLPGNSQRVLLDRNGLRDFWQLTFKRARHYSIARGDKSYRYEAGGIVVDSVIDETVELEQDSERLRLEESARVRIDRDRVVVEQITIVVNRN
jgi:TPR repeat protein